MPLVAACAVIVATLVTRRRFPVRCRLALAGAALAGFQRMVLVGQAILARRWRDVIALDAIGGVLVRTHGAFPLSSRSPCWEADRYRGRTIV